jgi:hypothetical protein
MVQFRETVGGRKNGPRVYWLSVARWITGLLGGGDDRVKEAALTIVLKLSSVFDNHQSNLQMFEQLLSTYVVRELANPRVFVRARACELLGQFNRIEYRDPQTRPAIIQGVYDCFMDKNLYLAVRAG